MSTLPWGRAVLVQAVEVGVGQELASVYPRLYGSEAAEDSDLLDVADDGGDLEPLQLRVDGV